MPSLFYNNLILKITLRAYGGNKSDKEISEEVAESKKAQRKALGTFNRKILGDFKALKTVNNLDQKVKRDLSNIALPYRDGEFILPIKNIKKYGELVSKFKEDREKAIESIVNQLPTRIEELKNSQGDGFREDLFPTAEELRKQYQCEIEIEPIPEANQFDKVLGTDDRFQYLKEELEENLKSKEAKGTTLLKTRLKKRLEELHDKLLNYSEGKRKLSKSLFLNTIELAEIVKSLNITDDTSIKTACNAIKVKISLSNYTIVSENSVVRNNMISDLSVMIGDLR